MQVRDNDDKLIDVGLWLALVVVSENPPNDLVFGRMAHRLSAGRFPA